MMYLSNEKLYFAGNDKVENAFPPSWLPCYIVDGKKTEMDTDGIVNSIFDSNGIIYTAEEDGKALCFWKGASKTKLNCTYRTNSVLVKDGEVFIASYYINESNSLCPHVPCYRTGTKRSNLPVTGDPADSHANTAISIFVE